MNFEDWEYHKSKTPQNFPQRTNFLNDLEKKFERELRDNIDKYADFFKPYHPDSIDSFITAYAKQKRQSVEYYEIRLAELEDSKEMRYRERTEQIFRAIKQKKLFNQQLLWRAEKITIPEIRMSFEFEYWENHIDDCPFLEPVTETELEVMKQYLRDDNFRDQSRDWFFSFQNYDEIMEKDEDGDYVDMPEWYEFYDNRCGTSGLLLLPDIRGEKEKIYYDAYFDESRNEREKNPPVHQPYIPPPPLLFASYENFGKFTQIYEDEYFKTLDRGYQKYFEKEVKTFEPLYDEEQIREAIELLEEADYPVMMPGGLDWREAIMRCAQQYINHIIAGELDLVFEEYNMLQDAGIGSEANDAVTKCLNDEVMRAWERNILGGRKQLGEPEDFDF